MMVAGQASTGEEPGEGRLDEGSAKQPRDLGVKARKMPSFLAWPPGLGLTPSCDCSHTRIH